MDIITTEENPLEDTGNWYDDENGGENNYMDPDDEEYNPNGDGPIMHVTGSSSSKKKKSKSKPKSKQSPAKPSPGPAADGSTPGSVCPDCGVFVTRPRRREHMASNHLINVLLESFVTEDNNCSICGKIGTPATRKAIARHAGLGCNMLGQVANEEQIKFYTT